MISFKGRIDMTDKYQLDAEQLRKIREDILDSIDEELEMAISNSSSIESKMSSRIFRNCSASSWYLSVISILPLKEIICFLHGKFVTLVTIHSQIICRVEY